MNKVVLIGRLTRDPELRYTTNNNPVCSFTLAVDREFGRNNNDANNANNQTADFINIVVWNKSAENCKNYLSKGSQCAVDGRLQIRTYDGQDGQRHYITEVIANRVEFIGSRGSNGGASYGNDGGPTPYDFAESNASSAPASNESKPATQDVSSNPFAEFGASVEINDNDDELPF